MRSIVIETTADQYVMDMIAEHAHIVLDAVNINTRVNAHNAGIVEFILLDIVEDLDTLHLVMPEETASKLKKDKHVVNITEFGPLCFVDYDFFSWLRSKAKERCIVYDLTKSKAYDLIFDHEFNFIDLLSKNNSE